MSTKSRPRVLVVCLGNELYRDDRAGLEVCRRLEELGYNDSIVSCELGFERCLGEILRKEFNILIIVDAFLPLPDSGILPGDVLIIEGLENIKDSIISSNVIHTHKLPLSLVLDYLRSSGKTFYPIFLGVCIENMDICDEFEECRLSENVEKGVEKIVRYIVENYLNGGTSI